MPKVPNHYVAIGASAGGLEALEQFFRKLPETTGMAFIVVQHLSPDFKSLMDELLARYTKMPVVIAKEGMQVEANHIYLIPPRKNLTIFHGKLMLEDQGERHHLRLPIDLFFKSLALDQDKRAIGIILSGTGSDGSQGIRAIKAANGMVMVQDEHSAKFDGMPNSAWATGVCDFKLPPEKMVDELLDLLTFHEKGHVDESVEVPRDVLATISEVMRRHGGLDFSSYKESTLWRRVDRRVKMTKSENLEAYVDLLQSSEIERETLQQEFLIGVTSFFRDEEAFQSIEKHVLPNLDYSKGQIRVWSAGCSTGEEVYSLAILLNEYLKTHRLLCDVRLFATDIDERALEFAGAGVYSEGIAASIEPQLLATYFEKVENGFKVREFLRKMVVFAKHNMLKDPPFSKVDLVVCRNVFIYLNPPYQQAVLNQFYYSLAPKGFLFLGSSESLGEAVQAYQAVDAKWKIFQCKEGYKVPPTSGIVYNVSSRLNKSVNELHFPAVKHPPAVKIESLLDRAVAAVSPPAVIVDGKDTIVHVINDVSPYVKMQPGRFSNLFTNHVSKDLSLLITNMIRKVRTDPEQVQQVQTSHPDRQDAQLTVRVQALRVGESNFFFISFIEMETTKSVLPVVSMEMTDEIKIHVEDLEQELKLAREGLQASIEELETSNEELQSSNEELIASNEELQSTNEEMQSVNEELYTVNTEYQSKIGELTKLTNDLNNLLRNTDVGAIYLDRQLLIRKITPLISKITSVLDSDISRPVYHLKLMESYPELMDDIYHVQEELTPIEREVEVQPGKWYLVRVRPYRTEFNSVEGIIITFIEISSLKEQQGLTLESNERLNRALDMGNMAWWEYDVQANRVEFSDKKATMLGYTPEEFPKEFDETSSYIHPEDVERTRQAMRDFLAGKAENWDITYRMRKKDGTYLWYHEKGQASQYDADGKVRKIVGTVINITPYKEMEDRANR